MKTAVEFFEDKLYDFIHPEHRQEYFKVLEQAKAMEKQQIIDSVCQHDIRNHGIVSSIGILKSVKQAEHYYNETFKTNKG